MIWEYHSGESARSKMEKLVLEKLPKEDGGSLETCLQSLRELRDLDAYKLADVVVQHVLDNACDALTQLQNNRPPREAHMQDDWGKAVLLRMPYFLVAEEKGDDGRKTRVAGRPAYAVHLADCQARSKKGQLQMEHMSKLHLYEWIATPSQKEQVQKLTDQLLDKIQTSTKTHELPEEKMKKKKMKKKKRKASSSSDDGDADIDIDALFG